MKLEAEIIHNWGMPLSKRLLYFIIPPSILNDFMFSERRYSVAYLLITPRLQETGIYSLWFSGDSWTFKYFKISYLFILERTSNGIFIDVLKFTILYWEDGLTSRIKERLLFKYYCHVLEGTDGATLFPVLQLPYFE